MATESGPMGPTNRWYKIGFKNLWTAHAKDQKVKILSAACFIATKFEAYNNRGLDYRTSHDIEDIIYVLDNRVNIVEEINNEEPSVRSFIKEQIENIQAKGLLTEVLMAHIHPLMLEERISIVEEKINDILSE